MKSYSELLEILFSMRRASDHRSLDVLTSCLEKWGNPEKKIPILHVVGSNGKGSTSAIVAQILQESGYRVGLFTSPHLFDYRERFQINRKKIPEKAVHRVLQEIFAFLDETQQKSLFFDITTLAAVRLFSEEKVDIAVFEAGMGGEKDATSLLDGFLVLCTNISLEHSQWLGENESLILEEKMGIAKHGTPVCFGRLPSFLREQSQQLQQEKELGSCFWESQDFECVPKGSSFDFHFPAFGLELQSLQLTLQGSYQQENLALALSSVPFLREKGFKIPDESISMAVQKVRWMGRMENITWKGKSFLFDGAHNRAGFEALFASLPLVPLHVLFSCGKDRNPQDFFDSIPSNVSSVYLFDAPSSTFHSLETLVSCVQIRLHKNKVNTCKTLEEAYNLACSNIAGEETLVICGSLYLRSFLPFVGEHEQNTF